jgi:hypothetical protein
MSNTDIFRIGPIPVSPITTRSESARHIDNCKDKSREILDWLINKGIITWCFSYWPSHRSLVITSSDQIGLFFAVLAQWKFLYCIDRFDHIKANKSKLINNIFYCIVWMLEGTSDFPRRKKNSPITTRSESARHFDNCKDKSREILDWLINKGIIMWYFSYWPGYRSSVCCIGVRLRLRPIQQASDL